MNVFLLKWLLLSNLFFPSCSHLNVILFKVVVTFKCHVYLLCFIIIALKCKEVVVMGMNDNWTILEVVAFANFSHFGCDAYWEKHLWECNSHHIWSKKHYYDTTRHASRGHSTTFMAKTTPKQRTQNIETACLICPYIIWVGDIFVMTGVNKAFDDIAFDVVPWYSFWFGPWNPWKIFIFYFVFFGSILKV